MSFILSLFYLISINFDCQNQVFECFIQFFAFSQSKIHLIISVMKFFYILTPVAIDKVWLGAQWDHSPTSLDTTFKNGLDHHLDHIFQTYL